MKLAYNVMLIFIYLLTVYRQPYSNRNNVMVIFIYLLTVYRQCNGDIYIFLDSV
jgi:hypothetical protein